MLRGSGFLVLLRMPFFFFFASRDFRLLL